MGGVSTNCRRVRRDFLALSASERLRYINAVKQVSTNPVYKPLYDAIVKKYKDFHTSAAFSPVPSESQFLPWLRFYLAEYENMLQLIDCRLTVPYWDWTSSPSAPYSTAYLDNTLGFGGSADSTTQCVLTGPFRSGIWNVAPSAGGGCLKREFKLTDPFPDTNYIQNSIVKLPASDFNIMHSRLKLIIFDAISCLVGGNMCGADGPSDPLHLLLISSTDSIFSEWQKKSAAHLAARYSTDETTLVCTTLPVKAYHDNSDLPNAVAVEYGPPAPKKRRRRAVAAASIKNDTKKSITLSMEASSELNIN